MPDVEENAAEVVRLATEVMGWKITPRSYREYTDFKRPDKCNISTWPGARGGDGLSWNPFASISDAWMLVEKLRLTVTPNHVTSGWMAAHCNWSRHGEITAVGLTNYQCWYEGPTAQEAICAAALAALSASKGPSTVEGSAPKESEGKL